MTSIGKNIVHAWLSYLAWHCCALRCAQKTQIKFKSSGMLIILGFHRKQCRAAIDSQDSIDRIQWLVPDERAEIFFGNTAL
jgi:hypothetical protein